MIRLLIFIVSVLVASNTLAQTLTETNLQGIDTEGSGPQFTVASAQDFINKVAKSKSLWKTKDNVLQDALVRLLHHTSEPYDSIRAKLNRMDLQSIDVTREELTYTDSLAVRWLNDSTFVIDSVGWSMNLLVKDKIELHYPVDFSTLVLSDSILDENGMLDSALFTPDTLHIAIIDTAALEALNLPLHQYSNHEIIPPIDNIRYHGIPRILPDSSYIVFTDTKLRWMAGQDSPFYILSGKNQLDSLHYAVETLLNYNERRDSTRLIINDTYGVKTPLWISNGSSTSKRFWVKNYRNDSITIWIGNPAKNEISLLLEDDINVNRLVKEETGHLPRKLTEPDRRLAKMSLLEANPIFWDYEISSAFTFNQTYLSNWTKGGESSIATMLDVMGAATYNNTEANTQWINSMRIKFGTLITEEKGLRKNNDLFEINSKFNRNASGKIGLSASFYMKNQIARGYNYPNDSVVVSKFLNPGTMTIGLGAEYKPFKHTNINMAPLSYKNTFVLDTVLIDQTKHGIDPDKKVKQELGTQIVLMNKFKPMEDLDVTSALRLFSNYLNHPENIDIDWELLVDKKINWFFTIRLNLHMIYDDDVRFNVLDANDQPVLRPDGSEKKVARTQFKEFIGLSLLFKF